ncbi:MAG: hypothetical protein IH856_20080 [Deltaproteobacteria bacterium]|nr:hypothetical protein [Deltaproteobacteria bacterium]
MTESQLNDAFTVYFGMKSNAGGISPVGTRERLDAHFGNVAPELLREIEAITDSLLRLTPQKLGTSDLGELADIVEAKAAALYPKLAPVVCRAIGLWHTYNWK